MSQVKSCCQSSAESTVVVSWLVSFAVRFKWRKLVVIGHFFQLIMLGCSGWLICFSNVPIAPLRHFSTRSNAPTAIPPSSGRLARTSNKTDRQTYFRGYPQDWAGYLFHYSTHWSQSTILSSLSICRKAEKSAIFLHDTRNDVYRRISVGYARRILREPWPYLDIATMCWIIDF